jgi:hypothetical protein
VILGIEGPVEFESVALNRANYLKKLIKFSALQTILIFKQSGLTDDTFYIDPSRE